ncbi:MAG: hypothetical protein HQK86_13600 [Nitrospinae bacterium]|nr:hypothetical protein [Nitrospinota bacterium]
MLADGGEEGGDGKETSPEADTKKGAQDKKLSKGDIKKLQEGGLDIHDIKLGDNTGRIDLYTNRRGDITIKPKGGKGPGEPTGYNIKDFR